MTTDDVLILISSQWDRGLIVPNRVSYPQLREALNRAVASGLVRSEPYTMMAGPSQCYVFTRDGHLRLSEIIGATVQFVDEQA